jgi:hypothetical protein
MATDHDDAHDAVADTAEPPFLTSPPSHESELHTAIGLDTEAGSEAHNGVGDALSAGLRLADVAAAGNAVGVRIGDDVGVDDVNVDAPARVPSPTSRRSNWSTSLYWTPKNIGDWTADASSWGRVHLPPAYMLRIRHVHDAIRAASADDGGGVTMWIHR